MLTFILLIHVIVCFFLIFIVLVQSGKGAELGAAFGGSSQTLFGARGAATFFSKLTTVAAIVFMITSLTLAVMTTKGGSVIKKVPAAAQPQRGIPVPQGQGAVPPQGAQPLSQQASQPSQSVPAAPVKK